MNIRKTLVKTAAAFVITSMLIPLTGCSEFLKGLAEDKVNEYTEEFLEAFVADPEGAVNDNSSKGVTIPELTEEQSELMRYAIDNAEFSVEKISVNEDRTKATVKINIDNYIAVDPEENCIDTLEGFKQAASDNSDDLTISVNCKRQDKGGWKFDDLSELIELFAEPYPDLCVLNEDGTPINVNQAYIDMVYVDCAWYDPQSGNPEGYNSVNSPDALQCVFYFNRPMTMTFTTQLCLEDEPVMEQEVSVSELVVVVCDFSHEFDGQSFEPGTYTVRLLYNDTVLAESENMIVSR